MQQIRIAQIYFFFFHPVILTVFKPFAFIYLFFKKSQDGIKMKRDVFIEANHSLGLGQKTIFQMNMDTLHRPFQTLFLFIFLSCYHHSSSFLRTCYPFNFSPPKTFSGAAFGFYSLPSQ
jgi:hypothetical protein